MDGSGNITKRFIYASRANIPDIMVDVSGANPVIYRIIVDQLGSPRFIINTNDGMPALELSYDEWGNETVISGNRDLIPFGFAGGHYDQDTKLVRFGARDYDPETGRWTGKDPIGFSGKAMNLYSYGLNDPVNLIDVSGSTWQQSIDLFVDWALARGAVHRIYGPGSEQVNDLRDAPGVNKARDYFYRKNRSRTTGRLRPDLDKVTEYPSKFGLSGLINAGLDPTEQFVGSFDVDIFPTKDGKQIRFEITNNTSMKSFLYGIGDEWERTQGCSPQPRLGGNMYQKYYWYEDVQQ